VNGVGAVIFDLDGVLIDSYELVLRAYRLAGVVAPDDVLAREGTSWLADSLDGDESAAHRVHALKDVHYLDLVGGESVRYLPPTTIIPQLADHTLGVLSGSPYGTIATLQARRPDIWYPLCESGVCHDALRTTAKMQLIAALSLAPRFQHGVYVDDQDRFINLPSTWRFIHYRDEPADALYDKIMLSLKEVRSS
jgi:hypothetical protein